MFEVGDRVVVCNSCAPVLIGYTGYVVDKDPVGYSGCVTVEFDTPMPFRDGHTDSNYLRHMRRSLLKITDIPDLNADIDIKFSFDSLIGEQHE